MLKVPDVLLWSSLLLGPEAVMLEVSAELLQCSEGAMLQLPRFSKCPEVDMLREGGVI